MNTNPHRRQGFVDAGLLAFLLVALIAAIGIHAGFDLAGRLHFHRSLDRMRAAGVAVDPADLMPPPDLSRWADAGALIERDGPAWLRVRGDQSPAALRAVLAENAAAVHALAKPPPVPLRVPELGRSYGTFWQVDSAGRLMWHAVRDAMHRGDAAGVLFWSHRFLDFADDVDRPGTGTTTSDHLTALTARARAAYAAETYLAVVRPDDPTLQPDIRRLAERLREGDVSGDALLRALDAARVRHLDSWHYLFARGGRGLVRLDYLGGYEPFDLSQSRRVRHGWIDGPHRWYDPSLDPTGFRGIVIDLGFYAVRPWLWRDVIFVAENVTAVQEAYQRAETAAELGRLVPETPRRVLSRGMTYEGMPGRLMLLRVSLAEEYLDSVERAAEAELDNRAARHRAAAAFARARYETHEANSLSKPWHGRPSRASDVGSQASFGQHGRDARATAPFERGN